jgi:hypothetical protein
VRQQSINCAAEFEHDDIANKDLVDATPRPPFTPRQWPPPRNRTNPDLSPLTEVLDIEMSDDFDKASYAPPNSEKSITGDDLDFESDPAPPPKKPTAQPAKDAKEDKTAAKKKSTAKKSTAKNIDVEMVADAEPQQETKPKKPKPRVRDEINIGIATKRMEESKSEENKYGDIVRSMAPIKQGLSKGSSGWLHAPVQLQLQHQADAVGGKRKLQREGAMEDITTFDQEILAIDADQFPKRSKQNHDVNRKNDGPSDNT